MNLRSTGFDVIDRRAFIRGAAGLLLLPASLSGAAQPDVFARVSERLPAPDFALEDAEHRLWRLSALRGRVVVVNFWATWCPPCRHELPSLESLHRATASRGAVVLGVNAGESWETVAGYVLGLGPALTFPILMDEKGSALRDWKVKALPATYVLDSEGNIVLRALGGRDFSRPDAIEDVTKLARKS